MLPRKGSTGPAKSLWCYEGAKTIARIKEMAGAVGVTVAIGGVRGRPARVRAVVKQSGRAASVELAARSNDDSAKAG
jgi:hypothetical protein